MYCILWIRWHDYPVDERDFESGMIDEYYDDNYECCSIEECNSIFSICDGRQYAGHEIVDHGYIILGKEN